MPPLPPGLPPGGPPMPGMGAAPPPPPMDPMAGGMNPLAGAMPATPFPLTTPEGAAGVMQGILGPFMQEHDQMAQMHAEAAGLAIVDQLRNVANPAAQAAMTSPASPLGMGTNPAAPGMEGPQEQMLA